MLSQYNSFVSILLLPRIYNIYVCLQFIGFSRCNIEVTQSMINMHAERNADRLRGGRILVCPRHTSTDVLCLRIYRERNTHTWWRENREMFLLRIYQHLPLFLVLQSEYHS